VKLIGWQMPMKAADAGSHAAVQGLVEGPTRRPSGRARIFFNAEDDRKMIEWVKDHPNMGPNGRAIWEEAENACLTCHSWQSMQNRYRRHLCCSPASDVQRQSGRVKDHETRPEVVAHNGIVVLSPPISGAALAAQSLPEGAFPAIKADVGRACTEKVAEAARRPASEASGISGSADGCAGSMSICKRTQRKPKLGESPGSPAAGSDIHDAIVSERSMLEQLQAATKPTLGHSPGSPAAGSDAHVTVSEHSMLEQLQAASAPLCKKARRTPSTSQSPELPAAAADLNQEVTILESSIHFAGWEYATLDRISPTSETDYRTQERFLPLPEGWEFSPTEPAIVSQVIQRFPWSTGALVCGDGHSHDTLMGLSPGSSSFHKITFRKGTYRPALNFTRMDVSTYRILIRKPVPGAFPTVCTPPKKSGHMKDRTFMCPEVEQHSRFKKMVARII